MENLSIKAIVEVEKDSCERAVFDEHLAVVKYRQVNAPYPFAYGFILNTLSDDGDGIDCYILTDKHLEVGETVDCVPIGLLEQFENDEVDSKVICMPENDEFQFDKKNIQQIKDFILQIFKRFPEVEIRFGDYKDASYATRHINAQTVS